MKKDLIIREIYRQNTQWKNETSFFSDIKNISIHRSLFYEILPYLERRQILSIVGLRRVGKTILMKQIIADLLKKGEDPKRIMFLSFDEALLGRNMKLSDYIESFLDIVAEGGNVYVFLDEIQYATNWQHILKRFYDTNTNIKFIVSGSSSLFLKKKTTESLAGRIFEFHLPVLSFREYMELRGVEKGLIEGYAAHAVVPGENVADEKACAEFVAMHRVRMLGYFDEYLKYGQFPEMVGEKDPAVRKKYLSEAIYKKTIEYDIPRIFGVEKIDEMKFVFQSLIHAVGGIVEYENLGREAGIEYRTLRKYLLYFEDSFLVYLVYNFSKSFRKSKNKLKKVYAGSTNFFSVFHDYEYPEVSDAQVGFLAENYFYLLLKGRFNYLSFFRDREKEFDFLATNDLSDTGGRAYFEVKYKNEIRPEDVKFIMKKARAARTRFFTASKDFLEFREDSSIIPIWMFK